MRHEAVWTNHPHSFMPHDIAYTVASTVSICSRRRFELANP